MGLGGFYFSLCCSGHRRSYRGVRPARIFVTAKVFLSQSDLPAQIAKLRTQHQHIDVISINGDRKELQQLAQESAGQFRFVTISDLQNALAQ